MTTQSQQQPWKPRFNPFAVALAVTLATFMEVLDTTIVNVSLPHIAGNLSASVDEAAWILTSYLVSNAIVLPIGGWLSMLFGRKRFYQTCVILFTVSSLLCGLAPNLTMLIIFRIMQGLGGGGLAPSEQAILVDTFPPEKRGMGMAVYGIAVVCAPIIGPTLGGWITDNFTWRWIFFINIPVGILSILLTTWLVEDPPFLIRKKVSEVKIDFGGLGLIALGLGFLQVVLDRGQEADWFSSHFIVICSIIAIVALVTALFWEIRQEDPVVDIRLFKDRNFLIANVLMFILGFVLFGSTLLLPLFLQELMGYSSTLSGMALSPGGFGTILLMPIVGFLLSKVEARWLVLVGVLMTSIALFHIAYTFNLHIDFSTVMIARIIQAAGIAFLFVPINAVAFAFIPKEKSSTASSLINLERNLGASFGISFATTILARRAQFHQATLTSHFTAYNQRYQQTLHNLTHLLTKHNLSLHLAQQKALGILANQLSQQATMLTFQDAFWILGAAFLSMIPLIFLLKKVKPGTGAPAVH